MDKLGSDEYIENEAETSEDSSILEEEYQEALGNVCFLILQAACYSRLLNPWGLLLKGLFIINVSVWNEANSFPK